MISARGIYVVVHGKDRDIITDKVTDVDINERVITLTFDAGRLDRDIEFDRITLYMGHLAVERSVGEKMKVWKGGELSIVQPLEFVTLW